MLILQGLALTWVMNSGTVLTGTDGFTSMKLGSRRTPATGAMSRRKTKLSSRRQRRGFSEPSLRSLSLIKAIFVCPALQQFEPIFCLSDKLPQAGFNAGVLGEAP